MPLDYEPIDNAWIATVPIPARGDKRTSAVFGAAWRACADRSAFLERIAPKAVHLDATPGAGVFYGDYDGVSTNQTFGWDSVNYDYGQDLTPPGVYVEVPDCRVGDLILVRASADLRFKQVLGTVTSVFLSATDDALGTPATSRIPGTSRFICDTGSYATSYQAEPFKVPISGVWTVGLDGRTRLTLGVNLTSAGFNNSLELLAISITATRFASTTAPVLLP